MTEEFQNIIIRMPNWIGDAVMATPVIADLRARWPQANITAMCQGRAIGELLLANPHLDEIFTFTKPNSFLRRLEERDVIERLRQGKYDLGVLLPNSFSSAWLFKRGRVKKRLGFSTQGRKFLLSTPVPVPLEKGKEHLTTTYKRVLLPLGLPLSKTTPQLFVTEEERIAAQQLLAQYQIPAGTTNLSFGLSSSDAGGDKPKTQVTILGVNPGAAYGSAKCWLPERFKEVIHRFIKNPGHYVLCFADNAGKPLVDGLCQDMPSQVINLAGSTSLRELMALIEQCSVFLTNDSGPMHIAAALNTPLVALFGSTNEVATGPCPQGMVIHKHVSCSPCYKRICPIDFKCMKQIESDEVYAALMTQLNKHQNLGSCNIID